jgi:xylulose-5-phosphate/fructose-6-phosphate phosphoketolase
MALWWANRSTDYGVPTYRFRGTVRGCMEEGTTTAPFAGTVLNGFDRLHRVMDAVDRLPATGLRGRAPHAVPAAKRGEPGRRIDADGRDLPGIRDRQRRGSGPGGGTGKTP